MAKGGMVASERNRLHLEAVPGHNWRRIAHWPPDGSLKRECQQEFNKNLSKSGEFSLDKVFK